MAKSRAILPAATVALLCACSSTQDDWNKASATNTVAAYQQFFNQHPTGAHSSDAADRIRVLEDDSAWAQAKLAHSSAGYRAYLEKQPGCAQLEKSHPSCEVVKS